MHAHRVIHLQHAEKLVEHRHEDSPAANAEQAREHTGNASGCGKSHRKPDQIFWS